MKFLLVLFTIMLAISCNSVTEVKDTTYWEKKVMETINAPTDTDGGGANYADSVQIIDIEELADGGHEVTFRWWGEYNNVSIQDFKSRKVTGEELVYAFDKNDKKTKD